MNRYEKQNAVNTVQAFIPAAGSFDDARDIALDPMSVAIASVSNMSFATFKVFCKKDIACHYPDGRNGLCMPDAVNIAHKIAGYLFPKLSDTTEQAFAKAKLECLSKLKTSLGNLRTVSHNH